MAPKKRKRALAQEEAGEPYLFSLDLSEFAEPVEEADAPEGFEKPDVSGALNAEVAPKERGRASSGSVGMSTTGTGTASEGAAQFAPAQSDAPASAGISRVAALGENVREKEDPRKPSGESTAAGPQESVAVSAGVRDSAPASLDASHHASGPVEPDNARFDSARPDAARPLPTTPVCMTPELEEAMTRAERAAFFRTAPEYLLDRARRVFHRALLDERVLTAHPKTGAPSNADKDSGTSLRYARAIVDGIGGVESTPRPQGQAVSRSFERAVAAYLKGLFPALDGIRPGQWMVRRLGDRNERGGIEDASEIFEQYEHLSSLRRNIDSSRELRGLLGYQAETLAPDVVVARKPLTDREINSSTRLVDPLGPLASASPLRETVQDQWLLHAVVSCKWTLRSDRAQQVRAEAEQLIRTRRGRVPHLVMVTGEPMPSRIAAVALGTGALDCVYHFALHELMDAIDPAVDPAGAELLHTMVQGRRLRDISDLPLDLAI